MRHFPPHKQAERSLDRRNADDSPPPAEVHSDNDEIDATIEWLAHLQAGRIPIRHLRGTVNLVNFPLDEILHAARLRPSHREHS